MITIQDTSKRKVVAVAKGELSAPSALVRMRIRIATVASSLSPASSPPRYPLIGYDLSKVHDLGANRSWMYASAPSATSGVSTLLNMLLLSIGMPYRQQ